MRGTLCRSASPRQIRLVPLRGRSVVRLCSVSGR
jgi:hypothetical protein